MFNSDVGFSFSVIMLMSFALYQFWYLIITLIALIILKTKIKDKRHRIGFFIFGAISGMVISFGIFFIDGVIGKALLSKSLYLMFIIRIAILSVTLLIGRKYFYSSIKT